MYRRIHTLLHRFNSKPSKVSLVTKFTIKLKEAFRGRVKNAHLNDLVLHELGAKVEYNF